MKNILKINIFFYFLLIISILIGKFKMFIFLTLITLFHEIGHIITGLLFNYKIEKIIILPIGSLTIFNKKINTNILEELLVTIMGPLFQVMLFFFIKQDIYLRYNMYLLIFNLLPIYPLDGHKILKLFLYKFFSFDKVNIYSLYFSILVLIILLIYRPTSIIMYFIFIIYFIQIVKEFYLNKFIFNKFLFERYLYGTRYKKKLLIKGDIKDKMHFNKSHLFIIENKLFNEQEILGKMFDNP